jgi:Sap, sulfolipid-1-addressing protein
MPVQLIPLAILAAITSPTTIAAVLVILNRPGPVPLLTGYVLGSFATSVLVGIAIVLGLAATSLFASRNGPALPSVDLGIGVLILLSAVWLHSARSAELRQRAAAARARRKAKKNPSRGQKPSRSAVILNRGSVGLLAALGVAMHLPGLIYLAALADIANANLSAVHAVILLVLFNVVMLAPIELPLLGAIKAPERTQKTVGTVDAFIRSHGSEGLLLASALAGGYLIVTGAVALVT